PPASCFNDLPTTEIYTLSLHDALPIWAQRRARPQLYPILDGPFHDRSACRFRHPAYQRTYRQAARYVSPVGNGAAGHRSEYGAVDRKSTRLNSSHVKISYAVFCLKKKK